LRLLPLVLSLAVATAVVDLVRRRRLREEFSWMWVLGGAAALVLGLWGRAREGLAGWLGTDGEGAVLTLASLFLALVCLDISTKVSRLANQQKNLAQGVARLEKRLLDLEGRGERDDG
jgi:cell division protein FtsW (lipid II flippase)